jgi:prepilin-type N-terminal cleavage/methylation domain-containing protein
MNTTLPMTRPDAPPARPGRRGFTLVESLLSVVIVSGVLVAALGTLGAIGKSREKQVERAAGVHLAEQVLAEIMQCYFVEPSGAANANALGTDAGESGRASFDDVDDYENWSMSPPRGRDGTAMPGYADWKVKVKVDHADLAAPQNNVNTLTGLKRIRVSATSPTGTAVEMYGLRTAKGAYEQSVTKDTTYLTWAGVSAQVGERGKPMHGGAHPLNLKPAQ